MPTDAAGSAAAASAALLSRPRRSSALGLPSQPPLLPQANEQASGGGGGGGAPANSDPSRQMPESASGQATAAPSSQLFSVVMNRNNAGGGKVRRASAIGYGDGVYGLQNTIAEAGGRGKDSAAPPSLGRFSPIPRSSGQPPSQQQLQQQSNHASGPLPDGRGRTRRASVDYSYLLHQVGQERNVRWFEANISVNLIV